MIARLVVGDRVLFQLVAENRGGSRTVGQNILGNAIILRLSLLRIHDTERGDLHMPSDQSFLLL